MKAFGAKLALVAVMSVAGCATSGAHGSPQATPADTAGSHLTAEAAEAVASSHVAPDARLVSARFGLRETLSIPRGDVSEPVESPGELVWLITYEREFEICGPLGACLSPRPGYNYVVVDDASGEWVTTSAYSPP